MSTRRISFITAVHNCLDLTREMLASLEEHTPLDGHEIVLVDDFSTDGCSDFLKNFAATRRNVRLVENKENLGFAKSNNLGAQAATGEALVFLNNDLALQPDWLPPMIQILDTFPQAGAVGNLQRNHATRLVDHAGVFFDLEGMPTHAGKNRRNPPRGDFIERNAVTAACMAIKAKVFHEVGGFDEGYRNGCEDVDLCMKLKKAGYRNYVSLRSEILHHISSSPGRNRHNDRNSQRFRERWSAFATPFGKQEWPKEYFRRYARYWWRMNPRLFAKALFLLLAPRGSNNLPSNPSSTAQVQPKDSEEQPAK